MALTIRPAIHMISPCSHSVSRQCNYSRQSRSSRCKAIPTNPGVFTATRLNASVVRIMGPGSDTVNGFGNVLAMDEFFVQPIHDGEEFATSYKSESLIYFLDDMLGDGSKSGEDSINPRHGIQVFFKACMDSGVAGTTIDGSLLMASYVREASLTQTVFLETGNGKGGAKVRVVAGKFAGLSSPIPSQNFVLLDVLLRPGSEANLPINLSDGLIIYILEGVGVFKLNGPSSKVSSFYENEGHGVWSPPCICDSISSSLLGVSTHLWSNLRFLLLGSSLGQDQPKIF